MALTGPEHEQVRLPLIQALRRAGWKPSQIQYSPEWKVPASPSQATLREQGRTFTGWPVDVALFRSTRDPNDWTNIIGLIETKEPDETAGVSQLETYLSREPRARFGVWTNGTRTVTLHRLPDGTFRRQTHQTLTVPDPTAASEYATPKPLTFEQLRQPDPDTLTRSFRTMLDVVVAHDAAVTRGEDQLDQLCNMLLLKLESDTVASLTPTQPVRFQLRANQHATAEHIRDFFTEVVNQREEIFRQDDHPRLLLDDHTITEIVYSWSSWNLLEVGPQAVSTAFQVFRRANLKAGEGQYYTPARIITDAVRLLEIQPDDKIIDPACGTGGFLIEAFRQMEHTVTHPERLRTWAHRNVYGVDKDSINVKLSRAIMMVMGDGSTHINLGDSLRQDRWDTDYPALTHTLRDQTFTVVLTNPPFGEGLKLNADAAKACQYTIARHGRAGQYKATEIGLIFLERAWRLLAPGGRMAIILPETYFFSPSYQWVRDWIAPRLIRRGEFNIPMEAFQGFCRAKTNLYIFEKTQEH